MEAAEKWSHLGWTPTMNTTPSKTKHLQKGDTGMDTCEQILKPEQLFDLALANWSKH
jgi:hypothetical protein